MLIDINPNIQLPKYKLVLCKLSGEKLQELDHILEFNINKYFVSIDEISFKIPALYQDFNGVVKANPAYNLIDGSMMILLNDSQYFLITKPQVRVDDTTGEIYKQISAFSREYELAQKKLTNYDAISRKLYDPLNTLDESGLEIGFLNYIERVTSWRIDPTIPGTIAGKYRALNFSSSTILQAFQEVQSTFSCIFQFDTINKIITVFDPTLYGSNQGLYISDKNFINNLTKDINHDEIKTRLYLYGKDQISINSISITGQSYIENLSFFRNTNYMSQELINALDSYDAYVLTKESIFDGYMDLLNGDGDPPGYNIQITQRNAELSALEVDLRIAQDNYDLALSDGNNADMITYKAEIADLEGLIDAKEIEIEDLIILRNAVYADITALGADLVNYRIADENLLKELDPFIREEIFTDTNYTEENLTELYSEGLNNLAKISYPNFQFNIEVTDFLSLVEGQHFWNKFVLGDLVTIEHESIGLKLEVRLIGYTHNPDSNTLNLTFSSKNSIDDANIYLRDLLSTISTTSSSVDMNKFRWDKGEDAQSLITQYINSALELAKQEIIKAENQQALIDQRGIWLYKVDPLTQQIDPKQMRLVNNILAITNDNWNTVSTAVSGRGVHAEVVAGKLGAFAQISADQIYINPSPVITFNNIEPTPPYYTGDIWKIVDINGNEVFKECVVDKTVGESFDELDWEYLYTLFYSQPIPPYQVGDFWYYEDIDGEDRVKVCVVSKALGESFDGLDWDYALSDKIILKDNDYNGVVINSKNGLVITRYIEYMGQNNYPLNKTELNATEGFTIYKNIGTKEAPSWDKVFYINLDGNVVLNGSATITWEDIEGGAANLLANPDFATVIGYDYLITGKITAEQIVTGKISSSIPDPYDQNLVSWIDLDNGTFNFRNKLSFNGTEFSINSDSVTINDSNGFEFINDEQTARIVFNPTKLAFQAWDGLDWVDKILFNPIDNEYYFNGKLTSQTTIVQNLYADLGVIARLTVDHLLTYNILESPVTMDYVEIQNNYIKFIHAIREDSLPLVQYTDVDDQLLYWRDELHQNGMSTDETSWPVMVYQYNKQEKMIWHFDENDSNHIPKIVMGIGTDESGLTDEGKAFIYKDTEGLVEKYYTEYNNIERKLEIVNSGIKVSNPGDSLNLRNIDYQTTLPTDLSNYSIGDIILVKV